MELKITKEQGENLANILRACNFDGEMVLINKAEYSKLLPLNDAEKVELSRNEYNGLLMKNRMLQTRINKIPKIKKFLNDLINYIEEDEEDE